MKFSIKQNLPVELTKIDIAFGFYLMIVRLCLSLKGDPSGTYTMYFFHFPGNLGIGIKIPGFIFNFCKKMFS